MRFGKIWLWYGGSFHTHYLLPKIDVPGFAESSQIGAFASGFHVTASSLLRGIFQVLKHGKRFDIY